MIYTNLVLAWAAWLMPAGQALSMASGSESGYVRDYGQVSAEPRRLVPMTATAQIPAAFSPAAAPFVDNGSDVQQETPLVGSSSAGPGHCAAGVEYTPLPHFMAGSYTAPTVDPAGEVTWKETAWPVEPEKISALLPNVATEISMRRTERSGSWLISGNKGSTQVIVDFIKYRSEPLTLHGQPQHLQTARAHARVGVGLRVRIDIDNSRVEASGSLLALAANMRDSRSQGRISMELMGIDSAKAVQAMPFTADVSEASIQRVIEAAAVVKSLLTEADTQLTPQTLALIVCADA